ncbi:MAG: HAD family hydrolase [Rikenellaceae bacterium]
MSEERRVVAIVYDFDGTLSKGNMQEYDFIPRLGMETGEFWCEADRIASQHDADSVLSYMERMVTLARERGVKITRETLREMGRGVKLFSGVEGWFKRINEYGASHGLEIRHYVNSSGIREMIEGTPIAKEFYKIYASAFMFDESGEAYWVAVAINYTNKTQFIFKINKGIESVQDSTRVNEYVPHSDRPIPFDRIIFIGDGLTDIPSMRLVHSMGGHAIALYDGESKGKREMMSQLLDQGRVNYLCKADYNRGSELDVVMHQIIDTLG